MGLSQTNESYRENTVNLLKEIRDGLHELFHPEDGNLTRLVVETANILDVSEYEVFQAALTEWGQKIGNRFTAYINREDVPWQVVDFCRKTLHRRK